VTYAAYEETVEASRPVEVYRFTSGATSYFYTSSEDSVVANSLTYVPRAISRGPVRFGPAERNNKFEIQLPGDDAFADVWKSSVPGNRVSVEVDRFQRSDSAIETIRIFEGFVDTVSFVDDLRVAKVSCRQSIGGGDRVYPREKQCASCNRVLYDDQCTVSSSDPAYRASALAPSGQSGRTLTVPGLSGTYTDGWFDGGMVEVLGGTDYRLVLSHSGNDLELLLPFGTTPASVNVFAGCEHTIAVCSSKFDNAINFGGFAFVPKINPNQQGIV